MPESRLDAILSTTRERIAGLRPHASELARRAALAPEPRRFAPALAGPTVGVIAEVKRRSPSAGAIREDLDPATHARSYEHGGAVAISVLTDERHFGGTLDDLSRVVRCVSVPVLRKDFILDELQLYEARAAGASAALLIVRALAAERLRALADAARGLALGVLVEVHSDAELDLALAVEPAAVGVNSRDLGTFAGDLGLAQRVVPRVHTPVERRSWLRESTNALLFRAPRSAFRVPLAREPEARMASEASPRAPGRFGPYGGRYVPETLMAALEELERVYETAQRDPAFWAELDGLLKDHCGRPTP